MLIAFGSRQQPSPARATSSSASTSSRPTSTPTSTRWPANPTSSGLTQRPFTTYDQKWELVCMLCIELPTLENGKAVAEDAPGGKHGVALTYTIRPDATWGDGTPITTKDVLFTWEVGRHPQERRRQRRDCTGASGGSTSIDDKTFTLHDEKLGFSYNAINDFRLLPEHLERKVFEADPATYRNRTLFDTDPTNPGLAFGPYRIAQIVPGSQIVLERNPTWWGEPPAFDRIVDQGDREYDRARGEPALRRGRHDRGLGRPVARSGAGLRAPPRRPLPGLLQARPGLRAHRRDARQPDARRPARPAGAALWPRSCRDQRAACSPGASR